MNLRYLPLLLAAASAVPCLAAESAVLEEQYKDQIGRLLPGMSAKEIPARKDPQQVLENLCDQAGAPGKEAEREALSKAIMAVAVGEAANREASRPARVWLLRKIEVLGREEVVAPLAGLLHDGDPEIVDLARRALANNPSEKALMALRSELGEAKKPAWKAAIINALAWRRDAANVEAFITFSGRKSPVVATAAISALGQVGNEKAADALADLRKSAPAELKGAVADASLRAAEALTAAGKPVPAKAIYTDLVAAEWPEHIRIAGLTGLANSRDADAATTLLTYAAGTDAHLRLIAARCLAAAPADAKTTRSVVDAIKKAAPNIKVLLIEVLGDRGDNQALPSVMQYMEDKDADVRLATYEAMGRLGDAATVNILVRQAATSEGKQREVIRNSLAILKGAGVDDFVIKLLQKEKGPVLAELIMAAWSRRITGAKPTLIGLANDPDAKIQAAVLTAMERLANADDLPMLAQMLVAAKGNDAVKAAEEAIASVCRRAGDPEKCVPSLVAAVSKASPEGKAAVIRLLARVQGQAALTYIREATHSQELKVKEAALAALASWKPVAITTWVYAGPFRQEGKTATALFDIAFPPESDTATDWKPLKNPGPDGRFDLNRVTKGDNCCVYAKTTIQSERKQDVVLGFGSDDGIKVWLGGKVVHAKNATRGVQCGEDQVQVTLQEGANVLLVKITQGGSDFAFCAAIKASDGAPADGVRFEAR